MVFPYNPYYFTIVYVFSRWNPTFCWPNISRAGGERAAGARIVQFRAPADGK